MLQQQVLEVLDSIKSLNERMVSGGFSGKVLQVQDLVVFSVGDWTSEEVAQLCRDAAASSGMEGALEILNNATLFGTYLILSWIKLIKQSNIVYDID